VDGSIECTVKATNSLNPVYTYFPLREKVVDGYEGEGIVVMAVDKLPSELPREASAMFGEVLLPYIEDLTRTDFTQTYDNLSLSGALKRAIIAHQGWLTPAYRYLTRFMGKQS
jgi:alpha-aminoadipic semialdehyde synthase